MCIDNKHHISLKAFKVLMVVYLIESSLNRPFLSNPPNHNFNFDVAAKQLLCFEN